MTENLSRCETCRFWSQMCAQALDGGPIEALCLVEGGSKSSKFTRATYAYPKWRPNHFGQVDDPPNYGEYNRILYTQEDEEDARDLVTVEVEEPPEPADGNPEPRR